MKLKPPWQFENPLCAELGPYYYYLEEEESEYSRNDINKAKSLCNMCDHKFDCAEWGIAKERFGIWGGLNSRERSLIRRRRRVKTLSKDL
jgi:hypothetical protein